MNDIDNFQKAKQILSLYGEDAETLQKSKKEADKKPAAKKDDKGSDDKKDDKGTKVAPGHKLTNKDGVTGTVKHRDEEATYIEHKDKEGVDRVSKVKNDDLDNHIKAGKIEHHVPANQVDDNDNDFFKSLKDEFAELGQGGDTIKDTDLGKEGQEGFEKGEEDEIEKGKKGYNVEVNDENGDVKNMPVNENHIKKIADWHDSQSPTKKFAEHSPRKQKDIVGTVAANLDSAEKTLNGKEALGKHHFNDGYHDMHHDMFKSEADDLNSIHEHNSIIKSQILNIYNK